MSTTLLYVVVLVALAVVASFLLGHGDPARQARILRGMGFGLVALETVFFGLFAAGEALTDSGGWAGVGLIAAWLVPLAVLAALAWRRPDQAAWALGVLTAGLVVAGIWFAVDPQGRRGLENDIGPIRSIAALVLVAALGVLGLARTMTAGVLLLVAGALPVLLDSIHRSGPSSFAAVGVPAVVTGAVYVAAAVASSRGSGGGRDAPADVPPAPTVHDPN